MSEGSIAFEDDAIILTFTGTLTQIVKKKASPRRIPLAAIQDLVITKPEKPGGSLRFVLAGSENLAPAKPRYDINTIVFSNSKQYASLAGRIEELRSQIGGDQAVPHPELLPPAEPHSNRPELSTPPQESNLGLAWPDPQPNPQKVDRKTKLADDASAGGSRPDIAYAASLMGWTLGGKRELRKLHEHVRNDETVDRIAQGTFQTKQGIVVLTDQRLLFVFHGWVSQEVEDFPLATITAISTKGGLGTGSLVVHAAGAQQVISSIQVRDLKPLADATRGRIGRPAVAAPPPSSPVPAVAPLKLNEPDPMDQLRKLADLRDAGVLTTDEFEAKKADILRRI